MKRSIFLILTIFTVFNTYCQSNNRIKLITEKKGGLNGTVEKYYIDNKNTKIRNGKYEKYNKKVLVQTGFYKNNLRDSTWTDFSFEGRIIATGKFKSDVKIGLWYYYSFKGDTIQIYNHTEKRMIYFDKETEKDLFTKKFFPDSINFQGDTSKMKIPTKMPVFIGGATYLQNLIMTNLTYPILDMENGIQGVSKVSFIINKSGQVVDVFALNSVSPNIDKEAIRLVKLMENNWEPAEVDGEKVSFQYTIPLTFKLID